MKVKIDDIRISSRIRQDVSDIETLKKSIQQVGLLNPIIISEQHELISGFRRLAACRELGWEIIDAIVMRIDDDELKKLDIELQENIGRMDLSETDRQKYLQLREQILNPPQKKGLLGIWLRFWEFIRQLFKSKK
ncbi:MAG TPA: hypothetical protein ENN22_11980 [bacterium]|nr:ParB N-terminal domain-containing protein [bacterium]HDP99887.1 hypothetical protein [bacterium]